MQAMSEALSVTLVRGVMSATHPLFAANAVMDVAKLTGQLIGL